jgi:hypothetical protein
MKYIKIIKIIFFLLLEQLKYKNKIDKIEKK